MYIVKFKRLLYNLSIATIQQCFAYLTQLLRRVLNNVFLLLIKMELEHFYNNIATMNFEMSL